MRLTFAAETFASIMPLLATTPVVEAAVERVEERGGAEVVAAEVTLEGEVEVASSVAKRVTFRVNAPPVVVAVVGAEAEGVGEVAVVEERASSVARRATNRLIVLKAGAEGEGEEVIEEDGVEVVTAGAVVGVAEAVGVIAVAVGVVGIKSKFLFYE